MPFKSLKILVILSLYLGLSGAVETPSGAPAGDHFTAVIGALDKITARITELDLPAGQRVRFGTLWITAKSCYKRPPEEQPETYIYLVIDDVLADGTEVQVFEGWMLASSPALNTLEHAVYDVWAIDCKTTAPEDSSGSK